MNEGRKDEDDPMLRPRRSTGLVPEMALPPMGTFDDAGGCAKTVIQLGWRHEVDDLGEQPEFLLGNIGVAMLAALGQSDQPPLPFATVPIVRMARQEEARIQCDPHPHSYGAILACNDVLPFARWSKPVQKP